MDLIHRIRGYVMPGLALLIAVFATLGFLQPWLWLGLLPTLLGVGGAGRGRNLSCGLTPSAPFASR